MEMDPERWRQQQVQQLREEIEDLQATLNGDTSDPERPFYTPLVLQIKIANARWTLRALGEQP